MQDLGIDVLGIIFSFAPTGRDFAKWNLSSRVCLTVARLNTKWNSLVQGDFDLRHAFHRVDAKECETLLLCSRSIFELSYHFCTFSCYLEYASYLRHRKSLCSAEDIGQLWTSSLISLDARTRLRYFDDAFCLIGTSEESYLLNSSTGECLSHVQNANFFSTRPRVVLSSDGSKLIWATGSNSIKFFDLNSFMATELQFKIDDSLLLISELFCTFISFKDDLIFTGHSYVDGSVLWTTTVQDARFFDSQALDEGYDMLSLSSATSSRISLLWLRTGSVTKTPLDNAYSVVYPLTPTTVVNISTNFVIPSVTVEIYDYILGKMVVPETAFASSGGVLLRWFLIGHLLFVFGSRSEPANALREPPAQVLVFDLKELLAARSSSADQRTMPQPIASFSCGHNVSNLLGWTRSLKFLFNDRGTSVLCGEPALSQI